MIMRIVTFFFFAMLLSFSVQAQTPEENLKKLGITLAPAPAPVASYVNVVRTGNLLFLSGKGPTRPGGGYITGKVGKDIPMDTAVYAARLTAIAHLSVLKEELKDLRKVKRIVKVLGMVNCTEDFADQPKVMNGYSNLMLAVFGEKGRHARSAVGMYALPFNMSVEVELIVEVE